MRKITVKVALEPAATSDPASVVRDALRAMRRDLSSSATVEEVFPGVRKGTRAGLVVVDFARELSAADAEAVFRILRARGDVAYAEPPVVRKPKAKPKA